MLNKIDTKTYKYPMARLRGIHQYWLGKKRDTDTMNKLQEGREAYYKEHGSNRKGKKTPQESVEKMRASKLAYYANYKFIFLIMNPQTFKTLDGKFISYSDGKI